MTFHPIPQLAGFGRQAGRREVGIDLLMIFSGGSGAVTVLGGQKFPDLAKLSMCSS